MEHTINDVDNPITLGVCRIGDAVAFDFFLGADQQFNGKPTGFEINGEVKWLTGLMIILKVGILGYLNEDPVNTRHTAAAITIFQKRSDLFVIFNSQFVYYILSHGQWGYHIFPEETSISYGAT